MDKIKILHVTYDMRIGGTEQVIKNLIQGSDSHYFEMSILCIESPLGPFANELLEQGINIKALSRQPGFDTKLIAQIRQHIKDNQIDIIHCHQYTPWVYGALAALCTSTKIIFTEHGRFYPDSSSWKRKVINPILNLFTHSVTTISKATKQALIDFESIPSNSIEIIYNGIAPLTFNAEKVNLLRKELKIPDENIIMGTVARFDPIKNHVMMLKAFAEALKQHPNSTLLIVGDGDERANIERCINDLGIEENVILAGYAPDPSQHIALIDIFLLSSLSEGTSMTLLEAMSIGKPCIVTNAGGNPEIIKDTVNGMVTPNGDSHKFSRAIIRLIDSTSLRTSYGKASLKLFNKSFSVYKMTQSFCKLYRQISSERK